MAGLIYLTLAALLLPARADAVEPQFPFVFKGVYEFGFTGMPFGHMGIEMEQTQDDYSVVADIKSSGIVKVFVRHVSHTTAHATGSNFQYPNVGYESNYQTKKKHRYVKVVFKNGEVVEEELVPPDNRKTRPAVPAEMKKDAADPLSLILRMREQLAAALKEKKDAFSINVYDGRRLTQANFTVQEKGPRTIVHQKRKVPVVVVGVRRQLLAGFTASELGDHDPNEPTLYIYFSNDERLIPIKMEANAWFGKLTATLVKECRTGESCLFGLK